MPTLYTGRRANMVVWLLCRLEAYDRNNNFQGVPVLLPEPTIPDWPVSGFKQLMPVHKIQLPKIRRALVESYFEIRMAMDKRAMSDLKAIQKGEALLDSQRIDACSVHITQKDVHFSGMVRAAMKKKVLKLCLALFYQTCDCNGNNKCIFNITWL